jgi:hypothetical protein
MVVENVHSFCFKATRSEAAYGTTLIAWGKQLLTGINMTVFEEGASFEHKHGYQSQAYIPIIQFILQMQDSSITVLMFSFSQIHRERSREGGQAHGVARQVLQVAANQYRYLTIADPGKFFYSGTRIHF